MSAKEKIVCIVYQTAEVKCIEFDPKIYDKKRGNRNDPNYEGYIFRSRGLTTDEANIALEHMKKEPGEEDEDSPVVFVDGSYNDTEGRYGAGIVWYTSARDARSEKDPERLEPIPITDPEITSRNYSGSDYRNIACEVFAATHVLETAVDKGMQRLTIFYDYEGICGWALGIYRDNNKIAPKLREAYQRAADEDIFMTFIHVTSHNGDTENDPGWMRHGNGLADDQAKLASGLKEK